ncbi:u3 small nucleolar rnaassociated protein [Stylonychia lemnae]|uniref:U3 small nucleolar rnaassociated protein n=1 Tax=Stylonychia lemnae TaxID=5949 RepID=A0A078A144_STYLE|nr:u3 small nucleolar rnaassociated protein [Stylonychia lemnae]|eukprot:CDW74499.1 u3 small nucleolar rnaassociated protein [Stylonychia lemnae]
MDQGSSGSTQIDIERLRFANYQPQGIESMALSFDKRLLAVSRESNSIEIWRLPYSWSQVLVIPGNKNCDIRRIHWLEMNHSAKINTKEQISNTNQFYYETQENKFKKRRLLTTGLNGLVIEWDLRTGKPKSKYSCNSAVWDSQMHGKFLYLACEDGTVKILKVKKNKIEYIRQMFKVDARCLSLALVRNVPENQMVKNIYAGYSDSSIRKWDMIGGNSVLHFQKQTSKKQKKTNLECCIWQLKLFRNHLLSGDSQGHLSVWDAEFGTLQKTFDNLKGDINTIEVNEDYQCVYASGIDSRLLVIKLKDSANAEQSWVFASIYRGQSHDIKSLILISPKQLISAGVTTDICVYNLTDGRFNDQFGKDSKHQQKTQKLRHIPPFPFKTAAIIDGKSICVLNGNQRFIEIWNAESQMQVLRIEKKGDYNIRCFDKLGDFIVYSDGKDTQIFHFNQNELTLKKLTQKVCVSNGLQSILSSIWLKLYQSDNEQTYLLILDEELNLREVNLSEDYTVKELFNLNEKLVDSLNNVTLKNYDKIINFISFNCTSHKLYVSFANLQFFAEFDLTKQQLSWNLPMIENSLSLCAHSDQDKLIVAYDSNKVTVFDLNNKKIHSWSAANQDKFPQNYLTRFNRTVGIAQVSSSQYIIYTNYTYSVLDINKGLPEEVEIIQNHPGKSVEEKNLAAQNWFDNLKISQSKYIKKVVLPVLEQSSDSTKDQVSNLTISNKIKGILNMQYDSETNTLKVVENVWKKVVENFVGTVAINKYGQ